MSIDKELIDTLFEKATLWESTVDSVPWVMMLLTDQGIVLRINRHIEQWSSYRVDAAAGKHWHEVIHPACVDDDCYLKKIVNLASSGESPGVTEVFDANLDRWVLAEITTIFLKRPLLSGMSSAALLMIRDVTKIREQRAFEIRATRAEAMRFLLRGIAHEMGNPLAGMRTTLEVMMENLDSFDGDKIQEYLNRLYSSTTRLVEVIRKTIDEGGKHNFVPTLIPTLQIINDATDVVVDFARGAGVEMVSRFDASCIFADRIAAHEVVLNVLKNAIEACPSGGVVHIDGIGQWECTQIVIVDNGTGMDSETMRKLFIPYCSTKPLGSGIGLAYSNAIMTNMGGTIAIHSTKDVGTCVTLSFPHQSPGAVDAQ